MKRKDKKIWTKLRLIAVVLLFTGCFLSATPAFAQAPAIHYFILEITGGVLANPAVPEVSILRAQCREDVDGIILDVQGGTHTPAAGVVTITDTNAGTNFGTATSIPDAGNPVFGLYLFSLQGNPAITVCPTSVTASFPGAAPAVADVDVRTAPIPPPVGINILGLEGPISAVVNNGDGTGSITVMGITVAIPATAVISTPTATLTIAQLANTTPLPGRTSPGFIGGTAIINGTTNVVTSTANDIFVEPAENVVIGVITAANCTNADCSNPGDSLAVLGSPVVRLTDARMPANPPTNDFGFTLNLAGGGLVGSPVALEGYFGQTVPITRPGLVDFDNDGKTDMTIYRPTGGLWFVVPSLGGAPFAVGWGGDATDRPAPGDYDGDGRTDLAIYRGNGGVWFVTPSSGAAPFAVGWGGDATDRPVPGDYDGDGKTDIAIYRAGTGVWYVIPSAGTPQFAIAWGGNPGDIPVAAAP